MLNETKELTKNTEKQINLKKWYEWMSFRITHSLTLKGYPSPPLPSQKKK